MQSLPLPYLHLETLVLPIFLAMILFTQLARAGDPGHYVQSGRKQMVWLVACFILLTGGFGALLYNVSPLLAVELAAGFTLSLLHPANALCFCVHLLYLRPWEIVPDNPALLALPRLLTLLCFFSWLIHTQDHGIPTAHTWRVLKLLLGFSAWSFLSTLVTPNIAESQADWFSVYFKLLIVFVMCLLFIDSEKSVAEFELTLVLSTLALMIVGIYEFFWTGSTSGRLETFGMFGNSNDLAAIIVMAIPFALLPAFRKTAGLGQQCFGLLFTGFAMMVIWYTRSRGAMLAIGTQTLTAGYLKSSGNKWLGRLLIGAMLVGGYLAATRTIDRGSEEMQISSDSRITYWKAAVNMTLRHPLFGVGYDQYAANYDAYSSDAKAEWGMRTAHSSWFLALAESGILGGALFVSFFIAVLRTAWKNRQRWPAHLYALVGYGVAMSFLSHTYTLYFYLLTGLVLASDALQKRSPDDSDFR